MSGWPLSFQCLFPSGCALLQQEVVCYFGILKLVEVNFAILAFYRVKSKAGIRLLQNKVVEKLTPHMQLLLKNPATSTWNRSQL